MKAKLSVAVDREVVEWIDGQVKTKRFASRSHAVDYIITDWIKKENKQS